MLLVFYLILIAVFTALSPFFLTVKNLLSIGSNMAFIGLMAAAGTPLIIAGGLDLSVAAVAGVSGVIVAMCYAAGVGIWAGLPHRHRAGRPDRRGQRRCSPTA